MNRRTQREDDWRQGVVCANPNHRHHAGRTRATAAKPLVGGDTVVLAPCIRNTDGTIANALQTVRKHELVEKGDLVAILAGTAGSEPGTTNLLLIDIVQ